MRIRSPTTPRLSGRALALASVGLMATDIGSQLAGDSVFPGGPLDETAHVLTTLLVLWALGPWVTERLGVPALVASVVIDLDHVPDRLGLRWFTEGTPRPYTHSLLTLALVLGLAAHWRSRRQLLLGVALGLTIHFWRDLAEPDSGVPLLWPISNHGFVLPHPIFVAGVLVTITVAVLRADRRTLSLSVS